VQCCLFYLLRCLPFSLPGCLQTCGCCGCSRDVCYFTFAAFFGKLRGQAQRLHISAFASATIAISVHASALYITRCCPRSPHSLQRASFMGENLYLSDAGVSRICLSASPGTLVHLRRLRLPLHHLVLETCYVTHPLPGCEVPVDLPVKNGDRTGSCAVTLFSSPVPRALPSLRCVTISRHLFHTRLCCLLLQAKSSATCIWAVASAFYGFSSYYAGLQKKKKKKGIKPGPLFLSFDTCLRKTNFYYLRRGRRMVLAHLLAAAGLLQPTRALLGMGWLLSGQRKAWRSSPVFSSV